MKTVLALLFLGLVVAVKSENCVNTNGCQHVACPETDYILSCVNHQCTCTHPTNTCAAQDDCNGNCNTWHCIDGKCRCFQFGGNGK
ncbi:hypothetical protein ACF0H5_013915 [Mactra antiquata]